MNRGLEGRRVVVAGGTGNVGSYVVEGLLLRGAEVVVPSRSEAKLEELREWLAGRLRGGETDRLRGVAGNVADPAEAGELAQRIGREVGRPEGVVASLGTFAAAASLLRAEPAELRGALESYTMAHFTVARTFLPELAEGGGAYLFINGPLAIAPWKGSGGGLVSVATAAQEMLFRALAQELDDRPVRVMELVSHAFIRERRTQPGSPLPGEAVGAYAAYLLSDAASGFGGRSVQLRSVEQLGEAGIGIAVGG